MIRVVVAGASGWVGKALIPAIQAQDDLALAGAVSRGAAGQEVAPGVVIAATLEEALAIPSDVVVDYTKPNVVKAHILTALAAGRRVVVGTSGLGAADYAEIEALARARNLGVVAAGNFSITATLLKRFTLMTARYVPDVEIIDYASAGKPDAPSGTARELAERLGTVSTHEHVVAVDRTLGHPEARGAQIAGTPVHSLRLPSFVVSTEVVFAQPDERLSIRHDAGSTPTPYVAGTLLAIRAVSQNVGVVRGLDTLLLDSQ